MARTRDRLTIGQLAKAAGVATSTVRYYERTGLMRPEARSGGNYRTYTGASVERLRFIRRAQSAGLSLNEIAALMRLGGADAASCEQVQEVLRRRLAEIEHRLGELRSVRGALASALRACACAPRGGLCQQIDKLARS